MSAVKYTQNLRRPKEKYINKKGTINLAFNYTNEQAELSKLPEVAEVLESQFYHPSINIIKSDNKQINGRDFIIIEMVTPAIDTNVYNKMFITSLDG